MNYYYITGTSRGLGRAIAELLLEDPDNYIHGYSRGCSIEHKHYHHHTVDLSSLKEIHQTVFNKPEKAERIILINNSGTLGEVNYVGRLSDKSIADAYNVNLIAPAILMNHFIKTFQDFSCEKMIINVTSGAATNIVDGWNVYCSSKAALDMYSKVAAKEQEISSSLYPVKIFSVAPGLVNTKMQDEIREVDQNNFSRVSDFEGYYQNNELVDPAIVAKQYLRVINDPESFDSTVISVRDFD